MAHGYSIKGVDISELYDFTGEEPYIEIPGYYSKGSKFKFNTYNAVYNGGWAPNYAFDPSNYNYNSADVLNLKKCAPKNTIIKIEHDADDYTVAKSKLDLPFLTNLVNPSSNVSREYYLQFSVPRASQGTLTIWHYESSEDAASDSNRVYDFNGTINAQFVLIRLAAGGGFGGYYGALGDTSNSGGGGATAFVLMRAQQQPKTYIITVGRGGRQGDIIASGGASSIETTGGRRLVWANGGGTKAGALSAAQVAITSDVDDQKLLYEAFRPVCTANFTQLTVLPDNKSEWPMSWGVPGKVGGTIHTPAEYFEGDSVYVSNISRGDDSSMYSENQNSSFSTKSMSTTYSGETVSLPSGGSSFCGRPAVQFTKNDISDNLYPVAVNLATKDIKYLTQNLAGTGGGGGALYYNTNVYKLYSEFNLLRSFANGGDGKISLFW